MQMVETLPYDYSPNLQQSRETGEHFNFILMVIKDRRVVVRIFSKRYVQIRNNDTKTPYSHPNQLSKIIEGAFLNRVDLIVLKMPATNT